MSAAAERGDAIRSVILDELRAHGPSRGPDLVGAICDLEGLDVAEVLAELTWLAMHDYVEVRTIEAMPYWLATQRHYERTTDHD
jgi:hypothetical protein